MKQIRYNEYTEAKAICRQYEIQIQSQVDNTDILDSGLPIRVLIALMARGISTIGKLRAHHSIFGYDGIIRIPHIGRISAEKIRDVLRMSKDEFYN